MALEWEEAFDDAVAVASSSPLGYHWGLGVAIVELSVSRALYLSPVSVSTHPLSRLLFGLGGFPYLEQFETGFQLLGGANSRD